MSSSGGQGVGQSDPYLHQVTHKANEIEKLFDCLPPSLQLEALDVLQCLVNSVMNKMTNGRVCSVRFVPVPAGSESNNASSAPEEPPTLPPEIEIKQEPIDEVWSTVPVTGHSIGMLQPAPIDYAEPYPKTVHQNQLIGAPLMTSTPKSKTSTKKKSTECSSAGKSKTGKRLLPKLEKTDAKKPRKQLNCDEMVAPIVNDFHQNYVDDVDVIDDSGIGDSVLDLSGGAVGEFEEYEDSESFEEFVSKNSNSGSEHEKDDPDFKIDIKTQSIKKVLSWSREAPKKRKKKDTSKLPFRCENCNFATSRKYSLDTHMSLHTGDSKFKCTECDKCFTAASSLKRHIMIHEGVRPFNCPVCQKKFVDIAGLRTHSAVHTGERLFKCELCPKAYTNHANLARHKRVHTGEMPYVCKYENCDAKFRDLSSLKLHILKHTGEKPYSCPFCQKRFKTSSDFRRHERTHTQERNYKCTECGKTFIQGYHLKQHLKIHADLWLFSCDLCSKRFRTKASLQHHTKGHAGVKDYSCEKCGNAFTTKRYLNDHNIAAHTDAKPYKCDICHKGFNHISNMKRHKRMHSDEFRYKCKFCSRGFKYINSLQYHEGIHTGEKKICEKCGFMCRSIATMKAHRCGEKPVTAKKKEYCDDGVVEDISDETEETTGEKSLTPEGSPAASENTSGDVEIVDVPEESEVDESTRKPRVAARKSGLMHTPRKSKQRAMKKIESITEELNSKSFHKLRIKLGGYVTKKVSVKAQVSSQKSSPVKKQDVKIEKSKVIHEKNKSTPKTQKPEQNGNMTEIVELLPEKSKCDDQVEKAKSKGCDNPKPKADKSSIKKNPVDKPVATDVANGQQCEKSISPKDKSLMEDISVMQEAYGSLSTTLTTSSSTIAKKNSNEQNCFLDSGFEDMERCMPIIAQVYSVNDASL